MLALALTLAFSAGPARQDLNHCPQPQNSHTLSTGEVVELPLCFDETSTISIQGYADLERVNELLSENKLYAISFDGDAQVNLSVMDYRASTLKPYQELFLSVLASPEPGLGMGWWRILQLFETNVFGPPENFGPHLLKIWVDSQQALDVGNEIWGYNKTLASFDIELTEERLGFRVQDSAGEDIVSFSSNQGHTGFPLPYYLDSYAISPNHSLSRVKTQGFVVRRDLSHEDEFELGDNPWARALQDMEWVPVEVHSSHGASLQSYLGR